MSSFSHLTLEKRIAIQVGLEQHKSFKALAKELGANCCTISREICSHMVLEEKPKSFNGDCNRCIHVKDCQLRHVCNFCIASSKRITPLCKHCKQKKCNDVCSKFEEVPDAYESSLCV